MIRFSASLVVVALGLLVAGGVTSKLLLVYVAIAVSAIALVFLIIGAILNRGELRASSPAEAPGDRMDEASAGRLDRAPADDREEAAAGRPGSVAAGVPGDDLTRRPDRLVAGARGGTTAGRPPWPDVPRPDDLDPLGDRSDRAGASRPGGDRDGASRPGVPWPADRHGQPDDQWPGRQLPDEVPRPGGPWEPQDGTVDQRSRGDTRGTDSAKHNEAAGDSKGHGDYGHAEDLEDAEESKDAAGPVGTNGIEDIRTVAPPAPPAPPATAAGTRDPIDTADHTGPSDNSSPSETGRSGETGRLSETGRSGETGRALDTGGPENTGDTENTGNAKDTKNTGNAKDTENTGNAKDTGGTGGVEDLADTQSADQPVTVVPGVPRYHKNDCLLIRFMGDSDLQKIPVEAAKKNGCTPCRACHTDGEEMG